MQENKKLKIKNPTYGNWKKTETFNMLKANKKYFPEELQIEIENINDASDTWCCNFFERVLRKTLSFYSLQMSKYADQTCAGGIGEIWEKKSSYNHFNLTPKNILEIMCVYSQCVNFKQDEPKLDATISELILKYISSNNVDLNLSNYVLTWVGHYENRNVKTNLETIL